jgi:hypothetical protein
LLRSERLKKSGQKEKHEKKTAEISTCAIAGTSLKESVRPYLTGDGAGFNHACASPFQGGMSMREN